jgi:hypothetical protein
MKSSRMRAKTDNAKTATKLLVAMTGKASSAKAAEGDEPVFAYIASMPQPQRGIAERIDALAAKTLPDLQRAVKWGMAYYGVGGGWCFSSGAFVGHVKLMFIRGTEIKPEPPVTPVGMGKSTRGVELASVDDLDERQAASLPERGPLEPGIVEGWILVGGFPVQHRLVQPPSHQVDADPSDLVDPEAKDLRVQPGPVEGAVRPDDVAVE